MAESPAIGSSALALEAGAWQKGRPYLARLDHERSLYSVLLAEEARMEYRGDRMAFHPTETLLPQIRKPITVAEFPFVEQREERPDWEPEALRTEIERLGHWEYYLEFSHGLTTEIHATFNEKTKIFHRYRSSLISETLCDLLGSELSETSFIDLGCHCGVMSLDLAQRGAGQVRGVEVRESNLAQARFLKDYYRIEGAEFEAGDVDEIARRQPVDVVLCLGLLYHVVQPVNLIEFCYRNSSKFAVIDTICHKEPISAFKVVGGVNPEVAIEGTRTLELHPTYRGLIDTMREVGFREIVEVVGVCEEEVELYSDLTRRCVVGFK